MSQQKISEIWGQLSSNGKLDRDRGGLNLQKWLQDSDSPELNSQFADFIIAKSLEQDSTWQQKLGICQSAQILAQISSSKSMENLNKIGAQALNWLSDDEVRVRISAGELLGAFCKAFGPRIYEQYREFVFNLVKENISRAFEGKSEAPEPMETGRMSPQQEILHDTAGWRNLESSVKCLQALINGCGPDFRPFINQDLLDLIFTSLKHPNRFVRETGYYTTATIIEVCSSDIDQPGETNPVSSFAGQFAEILSEGLQDNWSQVRMASAVAARQFLLCLQKNQEKSGEIEALLLPKICLNRYYLAEGVRIYSQDTWLMLTGQNGKNVVEKGLENYVKYYIECTQADNHAVREAACQCIAELAVKVDNLDKFVPVLLGTLIQCFGDESWPVRDMACVASGSFVASFPEASRSKIEVLKSLFLNNLKDPISSVRQGAAQAIAKMIKVYPDLSHEMLEMIATDLDHVKDQPVESHRYEI